MQKCSVFEYYLVLKEVCICSKIIHMQCRKNNLQRGANQVYSVLKPEEVPKFWLGKEGPRISFQKMLSSTDHFQVKTKSLC